MKILIIRNYPSYMDVRARMYNIQELGLAKALVRLGHSCGLLFWTDRREEDIDYVFEKDRHIQICYRKGWSLFHNTVFRNIDHMLKEFDVIQSGEYNQLESWLLAGKYPDKTIIYHGPYDSRYNRRYHAMCAVFDLFFLKRYIRNRTHFIVKSRLAEEFLASKNILREDMKALGVGIDVDALNGTADEISRYVEEAESSYSVIKLLYIGHLDEGRNILFILEVLKAVKDRGYEVTLNLVGTGEDAYVNRCRGYAEENGLWPNIHYTEKLEQRHIACLYRKSDFFLMPTRFDIFGMVMLEAMYYGLAVLTTENGGSTMMIEDGINGFRLPLDCGKWADLIVGLYEDKDRFERTGKSALETVRNRFTWDKLAPAFLEEYRRIPGMSTGK